MANSWKHVSEIRDDTLKYIIKRKNGEIKSFKTPWKKLNNVLLGGLERGGVFTFCARPGNAKTTIINQITNYGKENNPDQNFAVLHFQFEMTDRAIGTRELTKPIGLSMGELYSVESFPKLSDENVGRIERFHKSRESDDIYFVTHSITVNRMVKEVEAFNEFIKKPFIVTIDHSVLIKKDADENGQLETLYKLSEALIYLKKKFPETIYLVVSQMNREIEKPERRENGKIGNFPSSTDIFAGDALQQCSDAVFCINRPELLNITQYGPDKIQVVPGMIIFHTIKNRYGTLDILFFEQNLKYFEINEAAIPTATTRMLNTKI